MFLGAGLVLTGCGDDDTATTPAPAPAPPPPPPAPEPEPEPEPPAPEAPATPTGLMVSETTETSITWTWDAVEGATAYAVQASADETFDATDMISVTLETTHTASDLEPETSVFVRVAAAVGTLEDHVLSEWTTHVTGMSAMPPPEPEPEPVAPDPVEVTFSLSDDADSQHFMMADKDDDAATAMADVNTEIMVESNTTAVITPMFVDGASGVSVHAMAGNMPFAYVDWGMLQSMVLSDGATFMVQRTTVGANQEMEPTGDVAYVTCGPFECMDGMDPPEISIANSGVCNAWDPTVDIQVGKVDNDVLAADGTTDNDNDGVDLGIVTSSNTAMKIKHVWSGVANGKNTSTTTDAAKGNDKAITMNWVADITQVDAGPDNDADEAGDNITACDNTYDDGTITDRPDSCFRLLGPGPAKGAPNYLAGYSLELTPQGAGVTWGRVDWDDDPFEDLTCDSTTMMVMDQVDICAMFEAEVDYAVGDSDDWSPEVVFNGDNQIVMWRAAAKESGNDTTATTGKNFKTLWFDDDLNGKIKDDGDVDRSPAVTGANDLHDLYNQNQDDGNIETIWELLTDEDGDPNAGDLGKVDMVSANDPDTEVDESATNDDAIHPDGKADNYAADGDQSDIRSCTEDDGGDDDDGSICDAVWTRDAEVTFADGTFGCETTRMVSIKCTWDADGGMADGRNALPQAPRDFNADTGNLGNFLKCEAK